VGEVSRASAARRAFSWLWLALGFVSFAAYEHVFADPQFLKTFGFSLEMAVFTVLAGLLLIVPTAIWITLRVPKAKPLVDLLALLPFVIPPIILAYGLIRSYSRPPLALVASPALLVAGYVIVSFPYIYRSVDAGLRAMDLRTLSEAAQSLGASWFVLVFRVVLPNLKTALLSAVFLTFAIVVGELTLAVILAWPAFGPYMALVGRDLAYEPAALAIMSFALTWGAIGIIQILSRGIPGSRSGLGGTH
jgi:putative spermidine/putrescine transport system permease protein